MSPQSRFSPAAIRAALAQGDPLADAAFTQLVARRAPDGDLLTLLERVAETDGGAARAFLDACRAPVSPTRAAQLARGRTLVNRSPWLSGVVESLGCAVSLCAAPPLPEVLARTGGASHAGVTLMLDAASPAAMEPDSPVWRRLVRARLVQAAVRAAPRPSDAPCEETLRLAWAVCTWSHGYRTALVRLGVPVSADRAEAHQSLWREIGERLGVPVGLLAASPDDEAALAAALLDALPCDPEAAVRAAEALEQLGAAPPCFASHRGIAALSRHVVGPDIADRLGMPVEGDWRVAWRVALRSVAVAAPSPAPAAVA